MPAMPRVAAKLLFRQSRLELRPTPAGVSTYRDGMYCGPGWGFTIEDVRLGRIQQMPEAIDAIDQACRRHDQCFFYEGYFTMGCDWELTRSLSDIIRDEKSTHQQRVDALIMAAYFVVQLSTLDLTVAAYRETRDRLDALFQQGVAMMQAIESEIIRQTWPRH